MVSVCLTQDVYIQLSALCFCGNLEVDGLTDLAVTTDPLNMECRKWRLKDLVTQETEMHTLRPSGY